MKRILFVCLGNICRSPAAEEVLRQKAKAAGVGLAVDSAGLIDYHEGELPDARMRSHALRRGYRLTHRSRPVAAGDFERADLIVGMDNENVRALRRLAPGERERSKVVAAATFLTRHDAATIPDPYYGGPEGFERALDLIDDCCDGIIARLKAGES